MATLVYLSQIYSYYIRGDRSPLKYFLCADCVGLFSCILDMSININLLSNLLRQFCSNLALCQRPSHTYHHARPAHKKMKNFGQCVVICCDSLSVRQNSLMIRRGRRMNINHLLCASQSNVRHTYSTRSEVVVFPLAEVCHSHSRAGVLG